MVSKLPVACPFGRDRCLFRQQRPIRRLANPRRAPCLRVTAIHGREITTLPGAFNLHNPTMLCPLGQEVRWSRSGQDV